MMQPRSFLLDEAHHVGRQQTIQVDFTLLGVLSKKAPGELQVGEHRCRREPPFLFQVTAKFHFQPLRQHDSWF